MANGQRFRLYFGVKLQEWSVRVDAHGWVPSRRAAYYVRAVGKSQLASDLRNDMRFAENEICAFVSNQADETVLHVLSEIFADATDDPEFSIAMDVLLEAIKLACKKGIPRWVKIILGIGAGVAGVTAIRFALESGSTKGRKRS